MEQVVIREALSEDMRSVRDLIVELATFEREPEAVSISVEELTRDGFGRESLFKCWVAERNDKIIGMALVYPRYSTWKGRVIHLEDLIVTNSERGTGIGTALLDEVIKYAADSGVKRVSWEVLDWNERAIAFYEEKGARVMRDWDVVQLNEEGISNYLKKL